MDTEHSDKSLSLENLNNLSTDDLLIAYKAIFQSPPPKLASANFLRGNIAWALQARQSKKSSKTLRQALLRKANRAVPLQSPPCKTGTRLIREWQGQTHEVTVLDKGYLWQGKHYRSLSKIARVITGARWSGPRFFGLKETDKGSGPLKTTSNDSNAPSTPVNHRKKAWNNPSIPCMHNAKPVRPTSKANAMKAGCRSRQPMMMVDFPVETWNAPPSPN